MKILLDFDGVMVTTPTWQTVEHLDDGFMKFNSFCALNLAEILAITQADIVLTTTHRIHHDDEKWLQLLHNRDLFTNQVTKVNQAKTFAELSVRRLEVLDWVNANPTENYVIIDDDKSLRELPISMKNRWVETNFYKGLTVESKQQALDILLTSE